MTASKPLQNVSVWYSLSVFLTQHMFVYDLIAFHTVTHSQSLHFFSETKCLNDRADDVIVPQISAARSDRYCLLGRLANALFNIFPLLICDGGVGCWTLVRHQDPEAVPHDTKTSWRRKKGAEQMCLKRTWVAASLAEN